MARTISLMLVIAALCAAPAAAQERPQLPESREVAPPPMQAPPPADRPPMPAGGPIAPVGQDCLRILEIAGAPAEGAERRDFDRAIAQIFSRNSLATERRTRDGRAWEAGEPLTNLFRLERGPMRAECWAADVQIVRGAMADSAAVPVVTFVLAVWSPEAIAARRMPPPRRFSLAFPPEAAATRGLSARLGLALGQLLAEEVHRGRGELPERSRLVLEAAVRADEASAGAVAPGTQ